MLSEVRETIDTIRKQGIRLSAPVLVDLVGLIIFIFVNSIYIEKIVAALTSFNMHVSRNMEEIMGDLLTKKDIFALMSKYPQIGNDISTVLFLTFLMLLSLFIIYCIFQGISWFFAYKFAGHKESLSRIMLRFSLVNIPWFLFFMIVSFISLLFSLRAVLSSSPVSFTNMISGIISFLFIYVVVVSYTRLHIKNPFRAVKLAGRKELFIGYLAGFGGFLLLGLVIRQLPFSLQLILEVFFLLPLLTGLRVFFLKLSKN